MDFIVSIYVKNSKPTNQYYGICQKFARITKQTMIAGFALYYGAIALMTFPGTIETILTGVHRPSLAIYFPRIHKYSTEMTVLQFIFNQIIVVTAFITVPVAEVLIFVIFANMPMVPEIIKQHLEELTKLLERKPKMIFIETKHRIVQYIEMQRRYIE